MFLKRLILFFIIILPFNFQGQMARFNKTYGFPNPVADGLFSPAIEMPGGGYFIVYTAWNYSTNNTPMILMKINAQGDTVWTKKIAKAGGYQYSGEYVTESGDGNYMIAADFKDNSTNKVDYYLLKANPAGDTLWSKKYSSGDLQCIPRSIIKTSDKGYIIAGYSQNLDVNNNSLPAQMYVVKTDSLGNKQWDKMYGGSQHDEAYDIVETPDKGFLIAGLIYTYSVDDYNGILIKIDSAGNKQWQKVYDFGYDEGVLGIIQLQDGNYLLAGGMNYNTPNPNNAQGWLIKIQADGTVIWEKRYGGPEYTEFSKAIELNDGSIVAAGGSNNTSLKGQAGWILKVNATGDSIWSRIYDRNPNNVDLFYSIRSTQDNGFIMTGISAGLTPQESSSQAWVVKVDSLGCDSMGCQNVGINDFPLTASDLQLQVYPNPFKDHTTVKISGTKIFLFSFTVYDPLGHVVKKIDKINTPEFTIDRSGMESGIYFFELHTTDNSIGKGKLIVVE